MSVSEPRLLEWISLAATAEDKLMLAEIARRNGRASQSATIRRLIQEEAARMGIAVTPTQPELMAAEVGER